MIAPRFRGTAAVALQQVALAAILFLLIAGWLHIPDANAFEVLCSIFTALLIATVAGAGESAVVLRLMSRRVTIRRLFIGAAVVCVAALLWFALSLGLDHLSTKQGLWVGYLNSKSPASLRPALSYEHLYLWFDWIEGAVRWSAAGLLAAAAFAYVTCDKPWKGLRAIFGSATYWLLLLLLTVVGACITPALLLWTPGHGLGAETLSLVLRVLTLIALNALAIASLLQVMAHATLRIQSAGTGEPADSKPRTAEIP